MITVREDMHIVILHTRQIKLIQQRERVLEMNVIVRDAVHE